jgi:hypothetical protein
VLVSANEGPRGDPGTRGMLGGPAACASAMRAWKPGARSAPRPDPFTSDPSPAIRSCGPDATAPPVSAPARSGRPDLDLRPAASPDALDDPLDGRFDRGVSSRGRSNGQLGMAVQAHLPCAAGRQASERVGVMFTYAPLMVAVAATVLGQAVR